MYMMSSQHAGTFDHIHHSVITSGCDIVRLCIWYIIQFLGNVISHKVVSGM